MTNRATTLNHKKVTQRKCLSFKPVFKFGDLFPKLCHLPVGQKHRNMGCEYYCGN